MPPKFQYRARKTEDVDKRATQKGNDYAGALIDGVKAYKKRDGENWIRILPPTWTIENFPEFCNEEGPSHYGIDVWLHEYFGPGGSTALCNFKMGWEKSCFLDQARLAAEDAGDEDEAKQLKPRKKVAVALIDMKEESAGVQYWLMPWGLDRDIAVISKDRRTGEIYLIDDPDYGYDVFFDVKGQKLRTEYVGASIARKPSAITDAQLDYIVAHPLPMVLQKRTNAELQALYGGDLMDDDRPRRGEREERRPERREREPEPVDRGRSRDAEPEPERSSRRRPDPEPEPEPERSTPRSTRARDVESERSTSDSARTARSSRSEEPERRPTRGDSRDASGATDRSESSEDVTAGSETRTSRSRQREEPEPERPTTRSRTTVAADIPSRSASAGRERSTREAEPEPERGTSPAKSRAEMLRERFAKK